MLIFAQLLDDFLDSLPFAPVNLPTLFREKHFLVDFREQSVVKNLPTLNGSSVITQLDDSTPPRPVGGTSAAVAIVASSAAIAEVDAVVVSAEIVAVIVSDSGGFD